MRTALFAGVAFALATSAFAQAPAPRVSSSGSEDIEFVLDAAKGGMAEVEFGKLAAERAQNAEVKKFAERMVNDHSKAGNELKSLAQSKGIRLPEEIEAKDRALLNRLSKLNGAAFDRAYMQAMVSDHVKDVSEFSKTSKSAKDEDVRSWATKTLPALQEHLRMARDGNRAVGTSGRK
jgi:putative membrane protein